MISMLQYIIQNEINFLSFTWFQNPGKIRASINKRANNISRKILKKKDDCGIMYLSIVSAILPKNKNMKSNPEKIKVNLILFLKKA